eukprot:gene20643-35320_t
MCAQVLVSALLQVDNDEGDNEDIWFQFEESEPLSLNGFACAHADERGVLVVCADPVCIEAFEKAGQAISRNTASGDNTQDDGEEDGNEDGNEYGNEGRGGLRNEISTMPSVSEPC